MNVNDMNARKQAKFVKYIRSNQTPFSPFARRVATYIVLGGIGFGVLLEIVGVGTYARKRDRRVDDLVATRGVQQSVFQVVLYEYCIHLRNKFLFWKPPREFTD